MHFKSRQWSAEGIRKLKENDAYMGPAVHPLYISEHPKEFQYKRNMILHWYPVFIAPSFFMWNAASVPDRFLVIRVKEMFAILA